MNTCTCSECKYLKILNNRELYAICKKTGLQFKPFGLDTRVHSCIYAEEIESEVCSCYRERMERKYAIDGKHKDVLVGYCAGTKECEACSCAGDPARCNFYPEKRERYKADIAVNNSEVDFKIAEMAVYGCKKNPQAYSVSECLNCALNCGLCDAYRHAAILKVNGAQMNPSQYDHDNLEVAVDGLIKFRHSWCKNYAESDAQNDLVFRCKECPFNVDEGNCLVKQFIAKNGTQEQKDRAQVMIR
ncbi:MAG: hypothetical protein J6A25_07240 [Lachnospiraceae bacterium]|nr:hypothetical protein [Lachnospiraceae bacterium]